MVRGQFFVGFSTSVEVEAWLLDPSKAMAWVFDLRLCCGTLKRTWAVPTKGAHCFFRPPAGGCRPSDPPPHSGGFPPHDPPLLGGLPPPDPPENPYGIPATGQLRKRYQIVFDLPCTAQLVSKQALPRAVPSARSLLS
jgi:hypothetical protein